jgi:LmbE family N-acetylglucosaminyl deacetylase/CheY-like chemotaxis protein
MSTPLRVLLIEDSEEYAILFKAWLEQIPGVECVRCADGVEGAFLVRSSAWDMVVSDIELPGMSGIDLVGALKATTPWTQVVIVTAHQRFDYALQAVRLADAMLVKPIQRTEFMELADKLLRVALEKRRSRARCVFAIGAHPDDVEIGCGGTLARFAAEGADVVILTLTGGEAGGGSDVRRRESSLAAELLGAKLHMGNLPDRAVDAGSATISLIEDTLSRYQVTHVFTHSRYDGHQDHRNSNAASIVACRSIPNLFCYQAPSTTVEFQPNYYVEIEPFLEKKLAAIDAHASQASQRTYLAADMIRSTARYWGRFCGYGLAEPFDAIRVTQSSLA